MNSLFNCGYLSSKISNLIDKVGYNNLKSLSKENIIKYLNDISYTSNHELIDFDDIMNVSRVNLYDELFSLINNQYYVDIFFIDEIISIISLKIEGKKINDYRVSSNIINDLEIRYKDVFNIINEKNNELGRNEIGQLTNQTYKFLNNKFDKKIFQDYLDLKKNIINLKTFVRVKKYNFNFERFRNELLVDSYGDLWISLYYINNHEVLNIFYNKNILFYDTLKHFYQFNNILEFNKKTKKIMQDFIDNLLYSNDFDSLFLSYGLRKLEEINMIKRLYYVEEEGF